MSANQAVNLLTKSKRRLARELAEAQDRIAEMEARQGSSLRPGKLLQESEASFRQIIEAIGDVPYSVDAETQEFSYLSPAFETLVGYTLEDIQQMQGRRAFLTQVIEGEAFAAPANTPQSLQAGETTPIPVWEAWWRCKDGSRKCLEDRAVPIYEGDRLVRTDGLLRDITSRKTALEENLRLQQEAIDAQRRSIQELSTPIIPVMDRIIVMPLVGNIDTQRARDITRSLLAGIRDHRAKVVILDVTGVPIVDSGIASHLNKTIQAARLKGAHTIVTGISDAVAETIVDLGIDWSGIETLSNLRTGLSVALQHLGFELTEISALEGN